MSNFNFMKSGIGSISDNSNQISLNDEQKTELMAILSLFISNSMINAAKYVKYCDRNGITNKDIEYGLKYEVFEFLKREDLQQDIDEINNELDECTCDDDDDDENMCDYCKDTEEIIDEITIEENELDEFKLIDDTKITEENKDFIQKFHTHYEAYNGWSPDIPLFMALKNAIDEMTIKFNQ